MDVRLRNAIESGNLPKELVIVGPAGTGKTLPTLMVIHDLCKQYPLRVLMLRQTRASLTESVLVTYEDEVLSRDGQEYLKAGAGRENRRSYHYRSGATIVPVGLDRNPTRVLSTSWDIIYINECIEVSLDVWETLSTRSNRPGYQRLGWLLGDTNPSSPDHWLKRRCDSGLATLWETTHHANPTMWDGLEWTVEGLIYLDTLHRLTGVRRKRLLEGLWVQGEGVWFDTFDPQIHVTEKAEYDERFKTIRAIDTGLRTGAVWLQVAETWDGQTQIHVFQDYFAEGISAYRNAQEVDRLTAGKRIDRTVHDPAGLNREATGPSVVGEYVRAGMQRLEPWPIFSVRDGLALVESFVGGAEETPPAALFIHPRCTNLINAFGSYRRARRANQWMDFPEDPQHPYEDLIDALRGGLVACFPDGRRPAPAFTRHKAGRIF